MVTKSKSFLAAVALGFGLLFLGPATSTAQAQHARGHGDFRGGSGRHGNFHGNSHGNFHGSRHGRDFGVGRHFPIRPNFHARPFHGGFSGPHHRQFRLVRVFVYDPFPRWVVRRVYSDAPYADGYCPY